MCIEMAITYVNKKYGETDLKFPILHRVYYTRHDALHMREWLQANCRAAWYTSPGWSGDFVEFEDDVDATAFALRWS